MLKILRSHFHFKDYNTCNTFKKRIKIWGHRTNSLSGGPNLMHNSYKKFRNDHFGHFDDAILQVYKAN